MLTMTDWVEAADGTGLEAYHFHCQECGNQWKDYADECPLGVCPRCGHADHDNWHDVDNPVTVTCKFCHSDTPADTAHLHQDEWVGEDCCWDERLRVTE